MPAGATWRAMPVAMCAQARKGVLATSPFQSHSGKPSLLPGRPPNSSGGGGKDICNPHPSLWHSDYWLRGTKVASYGACPLRQTKASSRGAQKMLSTMVAPRRVYKMCGTKVSHAALEPGEISVCPSAPGYFLLGKKKFSRLKSFSTDISLQGLTSGPLLSSRNSAGFNMN